MKPPLNVHYESSDSMKTILGLHFPKGKILDVNHSLGVFYKKVEREVVGIDIRPISHILADNRALPFSDDSFTVGVCDPPYKRGPRDRRYSHRFGEAPYTTKRVTNQYLELLPELLRVSTDGIIIKAQDDTDGHKFNCRSFVLMSFMKELTGLAPHDVSYMVRTGVPENNINSLNNKRHFLANCVSYFLIYKWSSKNPFRPLRFNGEGRRSGSDILESQSPLFEDLGI
jgi:hypothetical protein